MPGLEPGIHATPQWRCLHRVDGRDKPGHDAGSMQMSGPRRLYRNARLLDPESGLDAQGDLLVEGSIIIEVSPGYAINGYGQEIEIVDLGGLCLAPGLVDMRVQLREPGAEHMESIESGGQAAAAGGVTTMVALPNTEPPVDDVSVVEFLARRAREAKLAKVHTYAAATKGLKGRELTEMGLLAANGAVGFTDGVKAVADALVMRRVLAYARSFDLLVIQHPEEPALAGAGEVTEGEIATRLGLAGITPLAEVIMVERDLRLVALTDARYHAAHVSTAAAIDAIRRAKAAGLPVTCDTAPPYFALNETAIGDYRTFAKLSPPLREEADRHAVVAGLCDGTIDAIASDHAPWDQDSKRLPFSSASYGIVGLETLLPLSLELYYNRHLSLIEVLRRLTVNPARILGLDVGRLKPGAPADLVIFDPDASWSIKTDDFRSKSKNAPFDGRLVRGRVESTIVDGREIFHRGSPS
jgi:dihydroorotase